MVILESDDGKVYHDNERCCWCQTFLDRENEEVIIRDATGDEYDRYSFEEWSARGPDNMDLYRRYSGVSRRVVDDPEGFLEDELFQTRNPDPRAVDVKYAELRTGRDASFFWEEFSHTDHYSDGTPPC